MQFMLPYMLRIKKKTMKDIELFNQFFFQINLSFCLDIYLSHDACTKLLPIFIFLT